MADIEPETEDQPELETERPLILGDGDACIVDTDYLDPKLQAEGVIAVQFHADMGMTFLYGEVLEGGEYVRTWKSVEIKPADKPKRSLRPVN